MIGALRGLCITAAASVVAVGLASMARADDFVAECKKGTSAADPDKACNCMSDKVSGPARADAIEGMRTMNATAATGKAPDPKALPANQQTALQAVIGAGQQCR